MNVVSHALVGYAVCAAILGPEVAAENGVPVIVAAIALDLDYLPQLVRRLPHIWQTRRWAPQGRTVAHELVGLIAVTVLCSALSIWQPVVSEVCFIAALSHYACDYVTGPSRPLRPFLPFVLSSELFEPSRHRWLTEGLITLVAGAGLWYLLA